MKLRMKTLIMVGLCVGCGGVMWGGEQSPEEKAKEKVKEAKKVVYEAVKKFDNKAFIEALEPYIRALKTYFNTLNNEEKTSTLENAKDSVDDAKESYEDEPVPKTLKTLIEKLARFRAYQALDKNKEDNLITIIKTIKDTTTQLLVPKKAQEALTGPEYKRQNEQLLKKLLDEKTAQEAPTKLGREPKDKLLPFASALQEIVKSSKEEPATETSK